MAAKTKTPRFKRKTLPIEPMPIDIGEPLEAPVRASELGGKEKMLHDTELLQLEWAIKYPNHSPTSFLQTVKSYSNSQIISIFRSSPADEWKKVKDAINTKMSESMIRRHIDIMAEVQEQHIKGSKLAYARVIEMLTKGGVPAIDKKTGMPKKTKSGTPILYPLRSIDLVNLSTAIEKTQNIYRKAMGLPNDEGGLAQILEKLNQQTNVQNNLHVHMAPTTVTASGEKPTYTYDQVMEIIEWRREQKAKKLAAQGTEAPKEVVMREPQAGDLTSLPAFNLEIERKKNA